jgi:hypothetical protein
LFEGAEDRCGKCGFEYCGECLVYAFGPKKPPLCIPCAVAAAGIRAAAGNRPAYAKGEMKRFQKERASAFKRFRRERAVPPGVEPDLPAAPAPIVPIAPAVSPDHPTVLPAAALPPLAPVPPPEPARAPDPAPWPINIADIETAVPDQPLPAESLSNFFGDDEFTTDPAYVDPTPTSIHISGI